MQMDYRNRDWTECNVPDWDGNARFADLEQMRSVTKFGLSIVTIVFKDNVDIYFARQLVFERLAEARERSQRRWIAMGQLDGNGWDLSIYPRRKNAEDPLQKYLTWQIWEQFRSGLSRAVEKCCRSKRNKFFGGYFKQYQVIVSRKDYWSMQWQ